MSDKMMLGILRMDMPSDNDPAGRLQYEANARLAADEIERLRTTAELAGRCEEAIEGLLILAEQNKAINDAVKDLFVSRGKSVLADIQKAKETENGN